MYDRCPAFFIPDQENIDFPGIIWFEPSLTSWRPRVDALHSLRSPKERNILANLILDDLNKDGVDRRGFLQCMAWVGTGMPYALKGD